MNQLESLKRYTTVVADTGDVDAIREFTPQDATTNPSLILKAAQQEAYADLVEEALSATSGSDESARLESFLDQLFVVFGRKILDIVPGRVSTEVDARLSFDRPATIERARRLIGLYEQAGVPRERVLIKIASTWEGIQAAAELEKEGIHCNLTLLFSFAQAVACAHAEVTLISPFVGRIYDYWKQARGVDDIDLDEDPGVASVKRIYEYFKKFGHKTQIMGASFRKTGQVARLCGCDLLTVSPQLLAELRDTAGELHRRLDPDDAAASDHIEIDLDEPSFRWLHNSDEMAVAKLAEGIRLFDRDSRKLERFARQKMQA